MLRAAWSLVTGLPWSLYSTFVIEARHGFNKQSLGLFISDLIKSVALGLLLLPPLVYVSARSLITWLRGSGGVAAGWRTKLSITCIAHAKLHHKLNVVQPCVRPPLLTHTRIQTCIMLEATACFCLRLCTGRSRAGHDHHPTSSQPLDAALFVAVSPGILAGHAHRVPHLDPAAVQQVHAAARGESQHAQ